MLLPVCVKPTSTGLLSFGIFVFLMTFPILLSYLLGLSLKNLLRSLLDQKLRQDDVLLSSLTFFKPAFHSLARLHPILWTPGPNPYELAKSLVHCKILSGSYQTDALASHWLQNLLGYCLTGTYKEVEEDLHHILPVYFHTSISGTD